MSTMADRRASMMSSKASTGDVPEAAMEAEYTIVVRGREFKLSYDQITHDEPNVFTAAFLQDFKESKTHRLTFNRSPDLFAIIVEHLSGYRILPLSPAALPPTMTVESALDNLAADALFYGLERLLDVLTLPPVPVSLSTKFQIEDCVRLSDLASGRLPEEFAWTDAGFVHAERNDAARSNYQPKHVLVFAQDVLFKIDLTCRANGDCHQALFGIELPSSLAGLRSKPLHLRDESQDWVATPAESLTTTPLQLDDFSGTFSDLAKWAGSFLSPSDVSPATSSALSTLSYPETSSHLSPLTLMLPGLAEEFRKAGQRGQTVVKLAAHFWATDMSLVIAPLKLVPGSGQQNPLAVRVLNVRLSTGLARRRRTLPACTLAPENGWTGP